MKGAWATVSLVMLVVIGIILIAGAFRASENPPARAESDTTSRVNTAGSPGDGELARLINEAVDSGDFTSARWGICVAYLKDGRVLYARNADRLFTPASNMKLYTTAVALDQLGPDYRWRTSVYTTAPMLSNGTINGDLTLYGRGAPDLSSRPGKEGPSSLAQLADQLYRRGVRQVLGDVIGDESYFRSEPFGDGWQWNDIQWYFGAAPSALSIDDNEVDIEIKPSTALNQSPAARLSSAETDLILTTDIVTAKAGEPTNVGIHRGLSDNNIRVWGEFPVGSRGFGARLSVHDPAQLAAKRFLTALKTRGISVRGVVRTRNFRNATANRFDPSHATELGNVVSKRLAEVIRATNKESINLYAELILRTLGRERGENAPAADKHKPERTDDEAGLAVIVQWLERAGIASKQLALHDGSGLSRLNLVTPEVTVRLLQAASKTASALAFRDSLPVAGTDGTLRSRLPVYRGRVSAKTGALTYTNSLSGYLRTSDGTEFVFSIMCNDETVPGSSISLIDRIVGLLAEHRAY